MSLNKNSTLYVTGFVVIVTAICAFIISSAATVLKPAQQEQLAANLQKNVLKVSGLQGNFATDYATIFDKNIEVRYIDLNKGEFVSLPKDLQGSKFDEILTSSKAVYDQYRTKLTTTDNLPGLKDNLLSNIQRVYVVKDDAGKYSRIVLPFYGNGLWSVMYGFLAVSADGNTVEGITYYSQGETPGLGGEVENPLFTQQFVGKTIYDTDFTSPQLSLVKNANPDSKHNVNALTGATLTSQGVNNQLQFWLGKFGYAKFLDNLHNHKVSLDEQGSN